MKDTAKTKKQLIEQELKLKEQILNSATDAVILCDFEGNILYINEVAHTSLGYTREEMLSMNMFTQVIAPGHFQAERHQELREKGILLFESAHLRKDGAVRPVEAHLRLLEFDGKQLLLSVSRDITERKQAEEELALRTQLLDNATDSIILRDLDGNILYANETAFKSRGYTKDEFMALNVHQLAAPEDKGMIGIRTKQMLEQGTDIFEALHLHKDGSTIPVEVNARVIDYGGKKLILSISRSIAARKQMQDMMVMTDRLAALGEMAIGFSHELNNPLTAVIGYAQLLLEDESLPEKVRTDADRIHTQAQRTANIIRDFMAFACSQPATKQPTKLNMLINNILKLREYEHKNKNITVITKLSPDPPAVMADASQLQQVFLDIIMNAEYFMLKAHNKGTLIITTEKEGDIVKASFADDGPGIPPENLSKIFNPFFTTKEVGQGTGLGLSICYSIITNHGGKIYADGKPGQGATFVIELPVASTLP